MEFKSNMKKTTSKKTLNTRQPEKALKSKKDNNFLNEIMNFNKKFVTNKKYLNYKTTKFPNKKIAILSCMDTRLIELLPVALNLKNGDAKIIKNAGGLVTHPFGSVMRSLLVCIYELQVESIMVVGHTNCGMQNLDSERIIKKMQKRNININEIEMVKYCGINIDQWLRGFDSMENSVLETVNIIKNHPFIPKDVSISGFIINSETGELKQLS